MTQIPGEPRTLEEVAATDADRFRWTEPLVPLEPDEVFVAPTVEELAAGQTGRAVKETDLQPDDEADGRRLP